jgi:DNA topoisomerase-3
LRIADCGLPISDCVTPAKKKRCNRRSPIRDEKQTARLKGFKSKAGKPFEAKLKIEEGEVRFVFED